MTGKRQRLTQHPHYPCLAVTSIEARVTTSGDQLTFEYWVTGQIGALRLPRPAIPARADGLWRHSCFEAFVGNTAGYAELNFSPSGQWAAYRFDRYRDGMRDLDLAAPAITVEADDTELRLTATVVGVPAQSSRLGLSAVMEAKDGSLSYWAVAHPPGRPDFHHPDCFALDLSPWDRP